VVAIFDFNDKNGKQAEEKLRAEGRNVTFFKGNYIFDYLSSQSNKAIGNK
jgi:hypothetical protein